MPQETLAERFENRFILGLGVSNRAGNERRGLEWQKGYTFMKQYRVKLKSASYAAPTPGEDPPTLLAGILPKMMELVFTEMALPRGLRHQVQSDLQDCSDKTLGRRRLP